MLPSDTPLSTAHTVPPRAQGNDQVNRETSTPSVSPWSRSRSRIRDPSVDAGSDRGSSIGGSRVALFRNRQGVEAYDQINTRCKNVKLNQAERGESPSVDETISGGTRRYGLHRLWPHLAHYVGYRATPARVRTPQIDFLSLLSLEHEIWITTFIGSFTSIIIVTGITVGLVQAGFGSGGLMLVIGSMGATSVLLYAMPDSPLSTPRNCIGGQMISALIGVIISLLFALSPNYSIADSNATLNAYSNLTPVAGALALALAMFAMQITRTLHPPGGATCLIAATQVNAISLHFSYLLLVLLSTTSMVTWACIIGNVGRRHYPEFWWTPRAPILPAPAPIERSPSAEIRLATLNQEGHVEAKDSADRIAAARQRWLGSVGEDEEGIAQAEVHEVDEDRGRTSRARSGRAWGASTTT